MEFRSK
jgi:glycerol uptake facilitator-like aquaporin